MARSGERRRQAFLFRTTGHHPLLGQPHDPVAEGPIADAEAVAGAVRRPGTPLGPPGRRFDRRSPFVVGVAAAAGVAVTIGAVEILLVAAQALLLVAVGLFLAIGLEPAVSWLVRHRCPRAAAVPGVLGGVLLLLAAFVAAAIPALVDQGSRLIAVLPQWVEQVGDPGTPLGRLSERLHLQQAVQQVLDGGGPGLASGVIAVGEAVVGTVSSGLVVLVLTAYFLADLPRVRATLYRFVPAPRRPRAILLGDQIMVKVGGYVLGNAVLSAVAAVAMVVWLVALGIPYPLLLAVLFALLDLVPVIGSLIAGALVALAAFSVSGPVGIATVGYVVAYKLVEDYLLTPRVFGRVLRLPAVVTICAILLGGALLGLVGALLALPTAAAIMLLVQEVLFPRLDRPESLSRVADRSAPK
ncbi:AI-2E family transporter [Nakamurella sp.]|uniref:AI-2E family transporter n=1 Tax=Nakamurella sp. TaxID=1869182 RepID=UPI003B3B89E9